ncbi:MAG TPA: hypothetical protein VGA13_04965 [Acidimicrobiales bacterium]|jgi:hypothetical protein
MTTDAEPLDGGDPDPRDRLLYESALRGVDRQATRLEEIRGRATSLFGAAAIAGGFLAAEVFGPEADLTPFAWIGAGAFAMTGCLLGVVLWPWKWRFVVKQNQVRELVEQGESTATMYYSLAASYEGCHAANEPSLLRLSRVLSLMVVGVVVEVVFLLLNLVVR